MSSGYEDRTLGLLKNYSSDFTANKAIVFLYRPKESHLYLKNIEKLGQIRELLQSPVKSEPIIVEIDPTDPWNFKNLLEELFSKNELDSSSHVLLDITSFTRVFLYELIKALYNYKCKFTIVYTEPEDYTDSLPAGVRRLVVSPSFMGKPRPNKRAFLLIFFGWETGRSKETFESFNSDDGIGVYGVEPIDKKHVRWQIESYNRNLDLIRLIGEENIDQCPTIELDNIFQYIKLVYNRKKLQYARKNEKFYFAISGFGPKIQNVASCFFALTHKDVQLVYGAPSYWGATDFSRTDSPIESHGMGDTYVYGPFDKVIIQRKYK